jgi:bis(5'-nucleosyl)-tetraphosphatase (symmetrical)
VSTYAIGDVQGCYDDLMRLLEKLDYSAASDTLWFAGDLVNRGSQSLQTLKFVYSLGNRAVCVLGNHDLHLLAAAVGARAPHNSDTFHDVLESSRCDELLQWLRQQPLIHHDTALDYVMVHAGIYPGWSLQAAKDRAGEVHRVLRGDNYADYFTTMYGNQPDRWSADLEGENRLRFIVNSFTRMRFCSADFQLDFDLSGPVGSQPNHLAAWFAKANQLPDTLEVIFGHWASLATTDTPGFHALDTGCSWGNALTAMNLETTERISVKCEGQQNN